MVIFITIEIFAILVAIFDKSDKIEQRKKSGSIHGNRMIEDYAWMIESIKVIRRYNELTGYDVPWIKFPRHVPGEDKRVVSDRYYNAYSGKRPYDAPEEIKEKLEKHKDLLTNKEAIDTIIEEFNLPTPTPYKTPYYLHLDYQNLYDVIYQCVLRNVFNQGWVYGGSDPHDDLRVDNQRHELEREHPYLTNDPSRRDK